MGEGKGQSEEPKKLKSGNSPSFSSVGTRGSITTLSIVVKGTRRDLAMVQRWSVGDITFDATHPSGPKGVWE